MHRVILNLFWFGFVVTQLVNHLAHVGVIESCTLSECFCLNVDLCIHTHWKVAYTQACSLVDVPLWLLSHQTLMREFIFCSIVPFFCHWDYADFLFVCFVECCKNTCDGFNLLYVISLPLMIQGSPQPSLVTENFLHYRCSTFLWIFTWPESLWLKLVMTESVFHGLLFKRKLNITAQHRRVSVLRYLRCPHILPPTSYVWCCDIFTWWKCAWIVLFLFLFHCVNGASLKTLKGLFCVRNKTTLKFSFSWRSYTTVFQQITRISQLSSPLFVPCFSLCALTRQGSADASC